MFTDLVLVLGELLKLDPEAGFSFQDEDLENGMNVYSDKRVFDPKNLSREALEAMIRHGWYYSDDDAFQNYYFHED